MQIEIDLSGRIEYTSKPTVIAFSNKKSKTLFISAEDKRKLQGIFREFKRPRIFVYKTFASLIYNLIKEDLDEIDSIVIDQEYQGREAEIKNYLLQAIRKADKDFPKENISFRQIGKKSNAHILAYKVYKNKEKPNIIIKGGDLARHLFRDFL